MSSRLASSGTRVIDDSYAANGVPDGGFRLSLHAVPPVTAPGVGAYSPRDTLTRSSAPRAHFGLAQRFLASKVGYISSHHNSDLLCTNSPGPKYNIVPNASTHPRQPALSWGEKQTLEQREKREAAVSTEATDVGPAAYSPRVANIKPTAPRCAFSRSTRFGGPFGSYQTLCNSAQGATMYQPSIDATVPSSPRFSFGAKPAEGESFRDVRQKPRTTFMTHSIRGGLAKPATLECNIGPGDYSNTLGDIGTADNGTVRSGFGSSPRFIKAGLQYISAEHSKSNIGGASPGPKYALSGGISTSRAPSTSVKWVP